MAENKTEASDTSDRIIAVLEPLLGRFTARKAAELAADQCDLSLATLDSSNVPDVCERLRPVLRTLLGAPTAAEVLTAIMRDAGGQGVAL